MNETSPRRGNAIIVAAIVAVLAVVVGIGWAVMANRDTTGDDAKNPGESSSATQSNSPDDQSDAEADAEPTTAEESDEPTRDETSTEVIPLDIVAPVETYGIGVGGPDAAAKVEVFVDFQCPHCADFEEQSQELLRGLAADDKAFVVYRPMAFLNEYSVLAMNAVGAVIDSGDARAALDLHDLFFEQQPSGDLPAPDWYVEQAAAVGADSEEVAEAIRNRDFQQWTVNGTDDASRRGVTGTPTVFVNGEQVEGNTIEELVANTADAVEAAQ